MKDITVIIVDYSVQAVLHKALTSLMSISSRLKSVVVIQEQGKFLHYQYDSFERIQFVPIENNDLGQTLNTVIRNLTSPYVLFLHDSDYLTTDNSLHLSREQTMLGTLRRHRNIVTYQPLLIRTPFLKQERLMSSYKLPFKEALFPAWFFKVDTSSALLKEGFVKQTRKNNSPNTIEKQKFIRKYQHPKIKTDHPSISVMMANYNMGQYVDNAIASCLFQTEQPEQVLIIDDGSTDNSLEQLQQWDGRKQVNVFHKANEGKAKALNDLLQHVKSDFILELDADDWLDPDAISVMKQYLSDLPEDASVLYGNLRRWKQLAGGVLFKGISNGVAVNGQKDLLAYRFPLGPRIYRTSFLKKVGGFPVVTFEDGRLYEDVSVLNRLIKNSQFCYRDFTVYNIREHMESITKKHHSKWNDFKKTLHSD